MLRVAAQRIDAGDARLLLAHVLHSDPGWLYAHANDPLGVAESDAFLALVARRAAGEPVAYLTGVQGFWSLSLAVTADTLIPRPETERLVELALERLPADLAVDVADLGTGSGAIALAIASERPLARVLASDASEAALAVARGNAARLRLNNVQCVAGDWLAPLAGRCFDLIASNPPYIEEGDAHLQQGDLRFEPPAALASGTDGLAALRQITVGARANLRPGGWLLLEHGWTQGAAVRALLQAAGFVDVGTAADLEGRERISLGRA
ncbi:MAG: peptide chain release factor N(5)-glutamine methyltransferase [Pseudoxanthomonas suwonensis]|nr:peptide chain release factor N(5)-glutamine methyltransferase [Pseudoxanthomonas suwonensis]